MSESTTVAFYMLHIISFTVREEHNKMIRAVHCNLLWPSRVSFQYFEMTLADITRLADININVNNA